MSRRPSSLPPGTRKSFFQEFLPIPLPPVDPDCFERIDLRKFCTKPLHEVELILEQSPQCAPLLARLIAEGRKYEYLSHVHFITHADLLDLLASLTKTPAVRHFPVEMQAELHDVAERLLDKTEQGELDDADLAFLIKMKIVDFLYTDYLKVRRKLNERKRLNAELNELVKDLNAAVGGGKGKKGKGGKDKKDKSSKKSSKKSGKKSKGGAPVEKRGRPQAPPLPPEEQGLPTLPLEEDDIVYDYNIDNHNMVLALAGFKRKYLIKELRKLNVHVTAVVEVASKPNIKSLDYFIPVIRGLFNEPDGNQYLDSTIQLIFTKNDEHNDPKTDFDEFVYAIKEITYVRRQHMAYIRSMQVYDFRTKYDEPPPRVECLKKYSRILDTLPLETITIPIILDALVEEICWSETERIYSWTDLTTNASSGAVPERTTTYQIHERDYLGMQMRSYKEIGANVYDTTIKMLRLMQPIQCRPMIEPFYSFKRTFGTPCDEFNPRFGDLYDYFHLWYFNKMEIERFVAKSPERYEFNRNFLLYDEAEHYEESLADVPEKKFKPKFNVNKTLRIYHLKEQLSEGVALQLIYQSMMNFETWQKVYCYETEAYLLRFYNRANSYGITTKIWNERLPTVICLRDFAKYVSNTERDWVKRVKVLKNNGLEKLKKENCEGLIYLKTTAQYPEYDHLVGITASEPAIDLYRTTFKDLMDELLSYPSSDQLLNMAKESTQTQKTNLVYDLGPKQVQLTGKTQILHSIDNVKVTIDTSRFLNQWPKMAIHIETDYNTVYYHSQDQKTVHCILSDGTIILVSQDDESTSRDSLFYSRRNSGMSSSSTILSESSAFIKFEDQVYEEFGEEDDHVNQIDDGTLQNISLEAFLKKYQLTSDDISIYKKPLPGILLEKLERALENHRKIYKISTRPGCKAIKRKISPLRIPLVNIIKRILFKPPKFLRKAGRSYCFESNPIKTIAVEKWPLRISLANGLYLSSINSKSPLIEIKQSYKWAGRPEKSRTCYADGSVVIELRDGSTTVLRSNGDMIFLTNVLDEACDDDCVRNLPKMNQDSEESIYKPSRTDANTTTSLTYKLRDLGDLEPIPYLRKTILDINGRQVSEIDGRISEKQVYFVINEDDHTAQERFYERDDGFSYLLMRSGKRVFQFPDETKISAWWTVEEQQIQIDPKGEAWLSIVLNYEFEHPSYVPFMYDAKRRATNVFLKNGTIKCGQNSCTICVKNLAIEINSNSIDYLKSCDSCQGSCFCRVMFNAEPIMEMIDDYGRCYSCSRKGEVRLDVNRDEEQQRLLQRTCCHLARNEHTRERIFVLNSGDAPYGSLWLNDGLIDQRMQTGENNPHLTVKNYYNPVTKTQTLELLTNVYQEFTERYTKAGLYRVKLSLSKYKSKVSWDQQLLFVTYRIFSVSNNADQYETVIQRLNEFLEIYGESYVAKMLEICKLEKFCETYGQDESDRSIFKLSTKDDAFSMGSNRQLRPTVSEILAEWRRQCDKYRRMIRSGKFPRYFHSQYYRKLAAELETQT